MPSDYTDLLLKQELQSDPLHLGYAGKDAHAVAILLNTPAYTAYAPAPLMAVLKLAAATSVIVNIGLAASKSAPFAGITALVQGYAMSFQYMLTGGAASLDVTDPAIVGAMDAAGTPYTPGNAAPIATPGMLDGLVSASVMTAAQKDALIALGRYRATRLQVLFTNPPAVDAGRVLAALRS